MDPQTFNPYSPPGAVLAEDSHLAERSVLRWLALLAAGFVTALVILPGTLVDPLQESVLGDPGAGLSRQGLIGLLWFLAPAPALLSDVVALGKVRRLSWLLLASGAAFLLWPVLVGVASQQGFLVVIQLSLVLAAILFWTALWGLAAEVSRGYAATGAVSATCVAARHTALLFIVLLGPVLDTLELIWFAVLACVILSGFGIYAARMLSKPALPGPSPGRPAFAWSSFLIAALLLFLLGMGRSSGDLYLKVSQSETSQDLLAGAGWPSHLIVVLGGLAYAWLCRRVVLRWLLLAAFGGTAAATALIFAEGTLPDPWIIEGRWSLIALSSLPLLDLSLRVVRSGREAFGFTILQGCLAFGAVFGSFLGGTIMFSPAELAPVTMRLALFAAVLPALALVLVFFLPRELGRARAGEIHPVRQS